MSIILLLSLIFLAVTILLLGGFWILIPILYGLPSFPANRTRIRRALELSELQPGEIFYDLGAGDGRVLIAAARDFGARAVGVEIEPVHCIYIWLKALASGLRSHVSIRWMNFYKTSLKEADVVFVYLTSTQTARLKPLLERQLRSGARVVSISADFVGWQPAAIDTRHLIFLYRMPPQPGNLESFLAQ